jgi:CRISPR-associated protein Cas1
MVPKDLDPRPLYVNEQGAWVGKRKGRVVVSKKGVDLETVRLIDVSQLCLFGNVQVSSQLLRELFAREVPTCWFSFGGWFSGMAEGLPSKNVDLRRRQVAVAYQGGLTVARRVVNGKILNSRTLLRRNARAGRPERVLDQLKVLAAEALTVDSTESLLGVEGAAARSYFSAFETMLRDDTGVGVFGFEGRNRRPPRDAVNCLLGYLYGLLVKDLTCTAFAVGFDPYLGFFHRPRFGRPALALDLAEEFRPLIAESTVLTLVNNGEVGAGDFVTRAGGVTLTPGGRKKVIAAYERRLATEVTHPVFGYKVSYRRVLEVQLRLLGAHLLGEVDAYQAFTTR